MSRVERLLAQVEANPDDEGARGVLIDALVEAEDPRGELAVIQRRRAELARQRDNGARWSEVYGPAVKGVELGRAGFVHHIQIALDDNRYARGVTVHGLLEPVLARRAARLVEHIALHVQTADGERLGHDLAACSALLAARAPILQSLELRLPSTAQQHLVVDLGPVLAPLHLRRLILWVSPRTLASVLAGTWPGIRRLELDAVSDNRDAPAALARLLDGTAFPDLEELKPRFGPRMLRALDASPLAKRLRVLDYTDDVTTW